MAISDALATLVATRNKALLDSLGGIGKGIGEGVGAYVTEKRKTEAFDQANQLLTGKVEVDDALKKLEQQLADTSKAPSTKETLQKKADLQQQLNNLYTQRDSAMQQKIGQGVNALLNAGVSATNANVWAQNAYKPTSNALLQSREQHAGAVERAEIQQSYAMELQNSRNESALKLKQLDLQAKAKKDATRPPLTQKLRDTLHDKKRLADEGQAIKNIWAKIKNKHFSATGPLGGGVPDLAVWDKDVQALRVRLDRYFSRYRKSITGSQAALKEIKLLLNEVPNKYDKVSTFETKMNEVFDEDRKDFVNYATKAAEQNDIGSYLTEAEEYQKASYNKKQKRESFKAMMDGNVPTKPSIINPSYIEEINTEFKMHGRGG